MKAIIIAGGQGIRLRPLTCNIPKPMMPVIGKPVLHYAIELLKKFGITDIGITLEYLPDEIINYFGDGSEYGVKLRYFIEDIPLGTAGSVKNAEDFLDDTFIVISGDALTDIDISKAVEFHKKKKSVATLILKEVSMPLDYGVVLTDKDGKIKGFLEKPGWGEVFSDMVNTGIYVLEPEIFKYYEKRQKFDFANNLFPILLKKNKPVYGYKGEGYWCDIGNVEQYVSCCSNILKGSTSLKIDGEKYKDGIFIGKNCAIDKNAVIIPPVYIGDNTKIYEESRIGPFSIIGKNNIISEKAVVDRSITFDCCYIGSCCSLEKSVLGKKVQLESGVIVKEGCVIGDDTIIRDRTIIKPYVSIWPAKVIRESTVVKSNVIWENKLLFPIFNKKGISGEANVEITPEFASKIASAYGSIVGKYSKIAVGCADDEPSKMIKYSFVSGLLSMGIKVYDFKKITINVLRQAVVNFGMQGAVYIFINNDNNQKMNIIFMDKYGLNVEKNVKKKIQNSFTKEDFRRVKTDEIKKIVSCSDVYRYYKENILNKDYLKNILSKNYKIGINVKEKSLYPVIQDILEKLNVKSDIYGVKNDLVGFAKNIVSNKYDIGVFIGDERENAIFIDENGNIIDNETYEILRAVILLEFFKFHVLAVPVTASKAMEEIAESYKCRIIRTKTSKRNILETYLKNEGHFDEKYIINSYLKSLDALSNLILTLKLMADKNCTVSSIINKFPKYYTKEEEIMCPWNMKGKVMRNLIEENNSKSIELIEGVKLNYKNAWALIIPDSNEPLCRLFMESNSAENVELLSKKIEKKIEDITGLKNKDSMYRIKDA